MTAQLCNNLFGSQRVGDKRRQLSIEPTKKYCDFIAFSPMDRDNAVASSDELEAPRFVEVFARQMQSLVALRLSNAFEQLTREVVPSYVWRPPIPV